LGAEERVVFPQPGPFCLYVAPIIGVQGGHGGPVGLEVTADAVPALHLQVRLHGRLQEGGIVPRGAIEDGSGGRWRGHRAELPLELLPVDVLGLVGLQQEACRVPDDVGRRLGREEELPRPADTYRPPFLPPGQWLHPSLQDAVPEAAQADAPLRLEGGGALDGVQRPAGVPQEEQELHLGGEFVLAGLAGHDHGDGEPAPLQDGGGDGAPRFQLVRA